MTTTTTNPTPTAQKPTAAAPTKSTRVDPSKLAPDFTNIPGEVVASQKCFWLGITQDIGIRQIDVAGLHFPVRQERITHNDQGQQVRIPEDGALNKTVTRYHFDKLVEVLPRLVIRQLPPRRLETRPGKPEKELPRAQLIKIPSSEMIAGVTKNGQQLRPYVKQPGDRPASEFLFFHHAPNGQRGPQGSQRPISETGLEWPGDDPTS